ncbi:hypothetical protein GKE82_13700 [Conexibacter sp. W3-3-2]|uniref:Uncharacterized protein n=1 Tax=Paraconexibacter algicola TaxID=2133960 RepID=A0A2T4UID7_9ACTN|nr:MULTISPECIES: hypothetical protein [Solirubrobacterales]MTD45311.1 hypothetical protein [Conexibacter sp. W3-3-2]PTL59006.1 hypothetical protein C7Y72_04760 [Paraconexibacter algicola]
MSNEHRTVLGLALAFTLLLGVFTIADLVDTGPTPLSLVSLIVLAMFAFGIIGALRQPPDR